MSFIREPRFKRFAQVTPRGTPRNCWERDRQTDTTRPWGPMGVLSYIHILLLLCLISLQQGFGQKCFAVDVRERGFSRRESCCWQWSFSLLCGRDVCHTVVCLEAHEDVDGEHGCHPCTISTLGTFGAEELWVLLPGAAEILQGWIFGLKALEQHWSRVCGQQHFVCQGQRTITNCPIPLSQA